MGRERERRHLAAVAVAKKVVDAQASPKRKMPWLQWFLVCDRVEQHANGGVTLHRTKGAILVPAFPTRVQFVATASFYDGDGESYRYDLVLVPSAGAAPTLQTDSFSIDADRSQESALEVAIRVTGPVTYFLVAFLERVIVGAAKVDIEQMSGAVEHEVTH